ncbi:hypothetical protein DFH09DRAFT_1504583 [Mycena vulgaris]|nr:hypothetical protein DFH09DRAFT_1504583 [Mycena vulgaris]
MSPTSKSNTYLKIRAPKLSEQNIYFQGLKLNGKKFSKSYLFHDEIANGATVTFNMGPQPSSLDREVPPSFINGDFTAAIAWLAGAPAIAFTGPEDEVTVVVPQGATPSGPSIVAAGQLESSNPGKVLSRKTTCMVRRLRWQSPVGRETIQEIIKKVVPIWKDGLRPVQEDLTSAIMVGDDLLFCTATGGGKSAAFSASILILNEYNAHPTLHPAGLPTHVNPVGIVVNPTKGLAANIASYLSVLELTRLNISAFAYSRELLADARREGINLAEEIKTCGNWQVICVDPEHLKTKDWREISESLIFRSKIIYAGTDEVHLINEWGTDFRIDFKTIGLFLRGYLLSSASIFGLSAALAPGKDTVGVCRSLGLAPTSDPIYTSECKFFHTDSRVMNSQTSSHFCRAAANLLSIFTR